MARLVEGVGVVLRRQGNELVGGCPLHEDSSPSLVVSTGKNLWHCLGACQAGGRPVDWVMTAQGVSCSGGDRGDLAGRSFGRSNEKARGAFGRTDMDVAAAMLSLVSTGWDVS